MCVDIMIRAFSWLIWPACRDQFPHRLQEVAPCHTSGVGALVDRRSVRRIQRRMLVPQQQQQAMLRHERCTMRRIVNVLTAPLSTVGRCFKASWLRCLQNLQPEDPVHSHQWAQPGDMINVYTKLLARCERVGYRITGVRRKVRSPGAGYEMSHVAVDDATRLSYFEKLPDEQKVAIVCFLARAVSCFNSHRMTCRRVLTQWEFISLHVVAPGLQRAGAESQMHQGLQAPDQRGKAERFI
jgi:hypothetical protein